MKTLVAVRLPLIFATWALTFWLSNASAQSQYGSSARVLMLGDSMSVGGFGEALQDYLLRRFGRNNVAVFASCGSSPEHWLRSGPKFVTKCGYREQTPRSSILN